MGRKNIKPNQLRPVVRTHVAKPALGGLTEENLTTTSPHKGEGGLSPHQHCIFCPLCLPSYDGDDAE